MRHYQLCAPADRIAFSSTDGQRAVYIKSAQGLIQASIPLPDKPTLWIIRGLPGSGKTALAREIAAELGILHLEPDMMITSGGLYQYTEDRFVDGLCGITEIIGEVIYQTKSDLIYTDVLSSIEACTDLADGLPHEVIVITMPKLTLEESMERNTHNVRRGDIEKMMADWEDFPC